MMRLNVPAWIVIHCSDSDGGHADAIAASRPDLGQPPYHWIVERGIRLVQRDGAIERVPEPTRDGRAQRCLEDDVPGAHAPGLNDKSIAICLVGRGEYTRRQSAALVSLILYYSLTYSIPIDRVIGHCETDHERSRGSKAKTCPRLDLDKLRAELRIMSEVYDLAVSAVRGIGVKA